MKTLIITAHPSSVGHTHRIAHNYKDAREELGHKVEILDLYAPENFLPYLSFENMRTDWPTSNLIDSMKEKILRSDEIVFVHPIWWSFMPAIMKNFIDIVIHAGFAYNYSKDGKIIPHLTNKTAKIFATSGGPAWIYLTPISPFKNLWSKFILGFVGMKVKEIKICGNMAKPGAEERFMKFLEEIKKSAKK